MPVTALDLQVSDPVRAARLFVDLLGGEPTRSDPPGARQPGGTTIRWRDGTGTRARLATLELGVDDAGRAVARLPANGTDLRPHGDGWRFVARPLGVDVVLREATHGPDRPAPRDDARGRGAAGTRVFDHVCFAVESLADAVDLLRARLGGEVVFGGHNHELGTLSSQVRFGSGTMVELLQPSRPDAGLRQFLDRHGPGMHHLTWHVHDVEQAARTAVAHDFAVVDTDLERRAHWRETYVRPSSALGLLVQLSWTDHHHDTALDDDAVAAILAGEVDSWGYSMRRPHRPDDPASDRND